MDFAGLAASPDELRTYVDYIATLSPRSTPERLFDRRRRARLLSEQLITLGAFYGELGTETARR